MSQARFRLRNPALLMALAAVFPVAAWAAGAARIDFTAGSVNAVDAAGVQRPLSKGAEIGNGDTVRTGDGGRAQLRFSDGAMVSLQPQTDFRIDDYQYAGQTDGQEKGFFSLLKGGLRTITGWVGRTHRENYKVSTSVATIGIRGTEFSAGLAPSGDDLVVATGEGLVEVCNESGCVILASGESGLVHGRNAPRRTDSRPLLPPASPPGNVQPVFSSASQGFGNVQSPIVGVGGIVGVAGGIYHDNSTATYNADGSLSSFTLGTLASSQGTASVADYGSDPIIRWARWTNGTITLDNTPISLSANQGLHLFWGVPTAAMPTSGVGNYTMIGGTSPTDVTGGFAPGTLNSAVLSVNFGTSTLAAAAVNFSIGGLTYQMLSTTGSISGNGFTATGVSVSGTPSPTACSLGCSGSISGNFFGASAERAGMAYKVTDGSLGKSFVGAAALQKF